MPEYYDLVRPSPNTAPIFPVTTIDWRATLTTQIGPLDPNSRSSPEPVFLGSASTSGAIIEAVTIQSKMPYIDPYLGGSGAGGPYGMGTPEAPVIIYFYSKQFQDDRYEFMRMLVANTQARGTGANDPSFFQPVLPHGQYAWRLAPNESIYVLLNKAIGVPGADLIVSGGDYSATPFVDRIDPSTRGLA